MPQDLREIAGLPVQQIPRRGSGARSGDALHRRSDGRRRSTSAKRSSRRRSAPAARCPKRARSSSASTIITSRKPSRWPSASPSSASSWWPRAAPRPRCAAPGCTCKTVFKVNEGRPNAVDLLKGGNIQLAIYTTTGAPPFSDEKAIRRSAVTYRVPCITTMSGARAAAEARRRAPARSDPRLEPAGNPREEDGGLSPRTKKTRRMFHRRAASFQFDPVLVTSWSPSRRGQGRYQYITESSPF